MTYPPAVSVVATSTLRWSGAGVYGGTIDVPAGAAEGDVLVVIAMHVPVWGPGVAIFDQFIDGVWTGAYMFGSGPLTATRVVEAGEPASYEVNFAPHGDYDNPLFYDDDGPAGNCVMVALRGVSEVSGYTGYPAQFLPHPDDGGYTPPADPFEVFVLANQHGGDGYDPDAVVTLGLEDRPPCPLVLALFSLTGVVGYWLHSSGGPDENHYVYRMQTCSWTTPTDESGVLEFTVLAEFDTGPTMMVAVAENVPAVAGPVGNVAAVPSAWTYDSFTPIDTEELLGVEVWGQMLLLAYPAPPPPPPAAGWYVGHPMGA